MIPNLNNLILAGGRHRCTPVWNRRANATDACFKIYRVLAGTAMLQTVEGTQALRPGHLYMVDGHRLTGQTCRTTMEVCWVHFTPESPYLSRLLAGLPAVVELPGAGGGPLKEWSVVLQVFERPRSVGSRPREDVPLSAVCRLEGLLLRVIALALDRHPDLGQRVDRAEQLDRFRSVIRLMEREYRAPPALGRLAREAGMAPAYFHRRFRAAFGVTPHDYMLRRRLDLARHLLRETDRRIHEIAAEAGYENAFYFSRVFSKQFGQSPKSYRASAGEA